MVTLRRAVLAGSPAPEVPSAVRVYSRRQQRRPRILRRHDRSASGVGNGHQRPGGARCHEGAHRLGQSAFSRCVDDGGCLYHPVRCYPCWLTTVDAFIIPYDAVHAAVAGFTDLDEVAPWRRMGSVAKTLHHATTPRAPQESQAVSRAVSPVPHQVSVLPERTVSPTHKVVLADPSHILIPRILVLQTQFKMNTLFLRQSWLLHSTPEDMFHVVAGKVECMTFAPGQLLVEKGKPPPGVLFLRRGVATVVGRTPSPLLSKAPTADCMYVMPGSVLGERSTVFNARSKESVAAVTFCDVWVLPKSDVERFRSDETVNHAWNTNAVSMATQWLQNIRTLERTRLLNRRAREEEERLLEDTGNGYSKKRSLLDVQPSASSSSLEGTPLGLLPMSTQRIIAALKTVSYMANAPLELLTELADAASPRVFLPQCAITTMSEWADALFVLTMGTATVQHGLTARQPPPNCSWVYRAGSCVGLECVVEHRSLFPVCSVTMVEAWSLPRGYLRERLAAHGYLQAAEHDAERVLSDLRLLLAHRTNIPRPSSGKAGAAQSNTTAGRVAATVSPRRVLKKKVQQQS
ncbi:cyclic nucleotide-binding protein, putative [Bodo saltans]|uniref:Cyclic nucleotide-binding protein, putative n=1 Tax=Bodo saltans TaxID=75058 RepID=A0A0S4J4M1_BODSA|nr:cyclic nucleotide-binding protein, putative [Bodo saltans]|eukprot:CUG80159.1 cyclic nucleotide-binding protein, putative [Bodo saltans]